MIFMNADKALERIELLLMRTEANGASPAEADTAARMVCKLLIQFPEILGAKPLETTQKRRTATYSSFYSQPSEHNSNVSVRYQYIMKQTEKAVLVIIAGKEVWLPLKQVQVKLSVIVMPRWLASAKDLI